MALEAKLIGPGDEVLLDKALKEVLYPNWPDVDPNNPKNLPDDHETVAGYMDKIANPPAGYRHFVMVVGENLDDPANSNVVGFSSGLNFTRSQTAAMVYLFSNPNYQDDRKAIESEMAGITQQALSNQAGDELKGLFVELQRPETATSKKGRRDAESQMAFYGGLGAQEVFTGLGLSQPMPYAQPWWGGDMELRFLGKAPTIGTVREFVQDVHVEYGERDPANLMKSSHYRKNMAALNTAEVALRHEGPTGPAPV
jgi:hypothetical protein